MKNAVLFCLIAIVFSSCTRLQWRSSDAEINAAFAAAQIPSKITYVAIDSLDLKVRIQTVSQGVSDINLVFLHGSPSSLSAWNKYFKDSLLRTEAVLHGVDRPGYGYSNFGDALTSIDTQAKVISAVIDEKQLKNVITIGSSYGGPVAARVAVENERVKGVIMISPAMDPENEQRIWQSDFTQFWLTRWLVPTGYRIAGDEKTVHAEELAKIAADWAAISIPVMHIHGDKDDLVPYENVEYTASVFPNIEVFTTPDTGHEIAWSRPDLIKPYILKMIEKVKTDVH